jgi:hypothetical protein
MTLNHYQRLFLHYYLGDANGDEVKAAEMAGYGRPALMGPRLLKSRSVCAELAKKLDDAGAMSSTEILARLSAIASLDVMEFVEFKTEKNRAGEDVEKPFVNLKKIKKLKKGGLIKDLKIRPSGEIEINLHNAVDAMDKLAKYHGLFKERIEIEHIGGGIGNDRIIAIIGGFAQLAGAVGPGAAYREPEPGGLRGGGEQWEVDARPALEVDQPTPAVDRPEGGGSPCDHPRPEAREIRADLEILPGMDDRPEAE